MEPASAASSISDRRVDDPERTFGLYLDAHWQPTWPAAMSIGRTSACPRTESLPRSRSSRLLGGRTGRVPAAEAVSWVRAAYRREAVETAEQEAWVGWFAEWAHGRTRGRP